MATHVVTGDQYREIDRRMLEIKRQLNQKGGSPLDPAQVAHTLQRIIEGGAMEMAADRTAVSTTIRGFFTLLGGQIAQVREWSREYGWGFTDEDFLRVAVNSPAWPEDRLTAVVLVPYLDIVERTFDALWNLAASRQENSWRQESLLSDSEHLRLLPGITHPGQTLRWETIDLGANRRRAPKDARNPKSSPHAAILAAAALHPIWVRVMDGNATPFVWLPGYQVTVPGRGRWESVPALGFGRADREVQLGAGWCKHESLDSSVPSLRK